MSQFEEDIKTYKFTPSQSKAVSAALDFIGAPFNPNKYFIVINGAGGTGKTYITDYIINHCKYALSVIALCSSTHKACRVFSQAVGGLEVNTIQSTFGFRLDLRLEDFDPNHPQFNPMGKIKLDFIKLLIIDEISMIPYNVVNYILNKCKELSIKVIGLGDASQLPPVNEKTSLMFKKASAVYTLKEVVRQTENNPISDLLTILRKDIDNKTFNFINFIHNNINNFSYNADGKGWCIVNETKFKDYIETCFKDDEFTKNIDLYRIVAYTNNAVANWNHYVRNMIIPNANNKIITRHDLFMSYETIVDDFLSPIIYNSEEYIIHEIVDYIDPDFKFKGFLIRFQAINGGLITKPLFVIDHKDNYTIQMYYKTIKSLITSAKNATGGVRSQRWKEYFTFKKTYLILCNIINHKGVIEFGRDIDYGFAITSHKSQGSTYKTVFVDINDMIFDKNGDYYTNYNEVLRRLYVACSRASNNLILSYGK